MPSDLLDLFEILFNIQLTQLKKIKVFRALRK